MLFKFISNYVHLTSDNWSYKAMLIEPARFKKAFQKGESIKFINDESGPPSLIGRFESISIEHIICIKNNEQ